MSTESLPPSRGGGRRRTDGNELAAGQDAEPLAAPDDGVAEEGQRPDGDLEEVFERGEESAQPWSATTGKALEQVRSDGDSRVEGVY